MAEYREKISVLAVCALLAGSPDGGVAAEEAQVSQWQKERDLLRTVERIQAEQGSFSAEIVRPLLDLGLLYISTGRCEDAVKVLTQALGISRAAEGLFNPQQTELLDPLFECYLALDLQRDFEREQQYVLLLGEKTYGTDDPRMLPAMDRAARWYEQAGRYISARKLHMRAVWLAERVDGKTGLGLVEPLRGIARAYRFEYVHGLHPLDEEDHQISAMRSKATFVEPYIRLDRRGSHSLQRAIRILRSHPDADREQLIDTLLDLGDWHQMENARQDAMRAYKAAWAESTASGYKGGPLFTEPVPIFYQTSSGVALRRPPQNRENYTRYWVDFEFTVTRDGRVTGVSAIDTNAPRHLQARLAEDLERTKYRPRLVAGEPVDTPKVHVRQGMYVERTDRS